VRKKSLRPLFDAVPDVQIAYIDEPYLELDGRKAGARFRIAGTMTGAWNPPGFAPTDSPVALEGAEFWEFGDELVSNYHFSTTGSISGNRSGSLQRRALWANASGSSCRA
jgi:hypothetical protein